MTVWPRRVGLRPGTDPTSRLVAVLGSGSVPEVVDALVDPSPEVARAAIGRLTELDQAGSARELRSKMFAVALPVVGDLARALTALGDAAAVETAIGGLGDEPYTRRVAAARALGELKDQRACGALRAAVHDPIASVRSAALQALKQLDPGEATIGECVRLLRDSDAQVRLSAVRVLWRLAPRRAGELSTLAVDPDCLVRREVALHVAALSDAAALKLFTDVDAGVRQAAASAVGSRQASLAALLLSEDPSSEVRRAAADALANLDPDVAADGLLAGIEDRDSVVRATAVDSLERLLTREGAVGRLARELVSARPERRRSCVYALAHLSASVASPDVWRLADDPEPSVRLAVIWTATAIMAEPEPLLLYMATDPDVAVRESARAHAGRLEHGQT